MYSRRALCLAVLLFSLSAFAQQPQQPPPCSQPEFRQLDFWVGTWDLTWPSQNGQPQSRGMNVIKKTLDDCVIEENFDGGTAIPLRGHSVSTYNAQTKHWQQTWVDNQGAYIDLTGEFKDGVMTLYSENVNPQGQKVKYRMIYKNIAADSFDWSWDSSKDDGKTWQVGWPIHYQRKSKP